MIQWGVNFENVFLKKDSYLFIAGSIGIAACGSRLKNSDRLLDAVMVTQAEPNPEPSTTYKRHMAVDSLLFNDFASYLLE